MTVTADLASTPATDDDDWRARGLCGQSDPDIFFPEKGGSAREAKRTCQRCPVRRQCLAWALNTDQPYGVWGGLTEQERRKLKTTPPRATDLLQAS